MKKINIFMLLFLLAGCGPDRGPMREVFKYEVREGDQKKVLPANCTKDEQFSDDLSGDVLKCQSPGYKIALRLYVPNAEESTVANFLQNGTNQELIAFTRKIKGLADKYKLNKWGFYFFAKREGDYFAMESNLQSSDIVKKGYSESFYTYPLFVLDNNTQVSLKTALTISRAKDFIDYTNGKNTQNGTVRSNDSAVAFNSNKNNRTIMNKNNHYLTLYHFGKNASDKEIVDFWHLLAKELGNPRTPKGQIRFSVGSPHDQNKPQMMLKILP